MSDLVITILEIGFNVLVAIVFLAGIGLLILRNSKDHESPSPCMACKETSCGESCDLS